MITITEYNDSELSIQQDSYIRLGDNLSISLVTCVETNLNILQELKVVHQKILQLIPLRK